MVEISADSRGSFDYFVSLRNYQHGGNISAQLWPDVPLFYLDNLWRFLLTLKTLVSRFIKFRKYTMKFGLIRGKEESRNAAGGASDLSCCRARLDGRIKVCVGTNGVSVD